MEYIGERAFSECQQLRSIHIPANVKEIDDFAFYDSHALAEIEFSEGLMRLVRITRGGTPTK